MNTPLAVSLALHLHLEKHASPPLFRQLYTSLRAAILDGYLEGGLRLPSTRQLASALGISRNTVVSAFEQLIMEGYLDGKVGSGTFVAHVLPEELQQISQSENSRPAPLPSAGTPPYLSAWGASLADRKSSTISGKSGRAFQPGIPAIEEFPYKLWSRLAAHTWRVIEREQLSYTDPLGYEPLRKTIADYVRMVRGMKCEPEQVIIMAGVQQTLALVSKMVLNPGDTACIEECCHPSVRQALIDAGARLVPIAVDQQGLSVERLVSDENDEKGEGPARLVYVTPSHQCPLGVTMSPARRLALLQWAARSGSWIVEDDYDSEYRYDGRPLPALQGLDQVGNVLYMGTFSKVLFPALRLSYLVVPAASLDFFARGRAAQGRQAPLMEQVILTAFFNEGHFARHIRRMNTLYQERQALLIKAVRRKLGDELKIEPNSTGLHVMGWLRPDLDDRQVSKLAQEWGIDVPPLSAFAPGSKVRSGLVMGYACVNPSQIDAGVDQLARALESAGQKKRTQAYDSLMVENNK